MGIRQHALPRRVLELRRVNAPPRSREDRELPAAGILQLASEALPLALRAGGGNEEPVRDGDREQQRCSAFEQLPTCTHANLFWKFRHFECRRRFFATGGRRCYSLSRRQASAARTRDRAPTAARA